jgi:hypothetical protein
MFAEAPLQARETAALRMSAFWCVEESMSNWNFMGLFTVGALAGLLAGCASREVEVTGELRAASGIEVRGPILLELFDAKGTGEERELEEVHSTKLAALGKFSEKADFSNDALVVRAIDDRNGDGACSSGEPWGEVEAEIKDDDSVDTVNVVLSSSPCPG